MLRSLALFTVLLTIPATHAAQIIAVTDLVDVTTEDLAFALTHGDPLPEGDLRTERDWAHLPAIIEQVAYQKVIRALASQEGTLRSPAHQAWLRAMEETQIAATLRAQRMLEPGMPSMPEIQAYVEQHRARMRLPPRVTWRFARFAVEGEGDSAEALRLAQAGKAAVEAGESFQAMAQRLALPPVEGEPGETLGPTEYRGRVFPAIEESLENLAPGEVSEPIATPVGTVLVQVLSRETDRYPSEAQIVSTLAAELRAERQAALRVEVMEELQEKHPLSLAEGVTPASPESTVVMRLGSHEVTVADVRRWALLEPNPQAALEWLLSPPGLASQMERNLLIAEMKATGQIDNPEMWRRLREVQRYEETERLIREAEQRSGAPIDDQALRRFWHERRSDYEQTLFAVETVWVPSAALARVAQSDVRYDHLAAAREIRDLLADGIGPDAVRLRMGVPELEHQRWERAMRRDLPSGIHETIASVQPGEWSEVRMTPSGALLVHLMDRYRGVPPLESTLPEVRRDFARSQAPERPLQERLLEEHDYRLVIDPSRLRWTDEGELTVIDAPEEGTETE